MKRFLTTALVAATFFTGVAYAADANIPWADNSGGTAVTADAFAKMSYAQRLDLYKTDKETYDTLTGRKGE